MKRMMVWGMVAALVMGLAACLSEKEVEEGFVTDETALDLKGFEKVEVGGAVDVYFTQGEDFKISTTLSSDPNVKLYVKQEGKTLKVYTRSKIGAGDDEKPVVKFSAPLLTEVEVSGASLFETDSVGCNGRLEVEASGAAKVQLKRIVCQDLAVECSGAAKLDIGQSVCDKLVVENAGAANLLGSIKAGEAKMVCSGAADCQMDFKGGPIGLNCSGACHVTMTLNCDGVTADCSGAAKVKLSGWAAKTAFTKSGAGKIDSAELKAAP